MESQKKLKSVQHRARTVASHRFNTVQNRFNTVHNRGRAALQRREKRANSNRASARRLKPLVWDGHSCPSPLILFLMLICVKPELRAKAQNGIRFQPRRGDR